MTTVLKEERIVAIHCDLRLSLYEKKGSEDAVKQERERRSGN